MTKALPPHDEPDEQVEPLVELVPTKAAEYRGPVGLAFAIGVNLEPTQRLFDLAADMIESACDEARKAEPKKLRAKRKRRKPAP